MLQTGRSPRAIFGCWPRSLWWWLLLLLRNWATDRDSGRRTLAVGVIALAGYTLLFWQTRSTVNSLLKSLA